MVNLKFYLKLFVLNIDEYFGPLLRRHWLDQIFSGWKKFFTDYEYGNNIDKTMNDFELNPRMMNYGIWNATMMEF